MNNPSPTPKVTKMEEITTWLMIVVFFTFSFGMGWIAATKYRPIAQDLQECLFRDRECHEDRDRAYKAFAHLLTNSCSGSIVF